MSKEAIILAGGLGTRLRSAVPELPKCMAPVAGKPFLFYVINALRMQGVEKFIFSLGYKHEVIEAWLHDHFGTLAYQVVIEEEPLGTGGAIKYACSKATEATVVVTNGDTLFKAQLDPLRALHAERGAECSLALRPMENFDRYGVVETDASGAVTSFREKQQYEKGNINGGLYLLNVAQFLAHDFPEKFSFEKDYLEKYCGQLPFFALPDAAYFIDIGIPEDFNRAQEELALKPLDLNAIDQSWTLFLDRDGVINIDKPGSYIFHPDEFIFLEGLPEGFKKLKQKFGRCIVVTNQRGTGRGLMTEATLHTIHDKMKSAIAAAGGLIDAVYYSTAVDNHYPTRKPNPGMALQASKDVPGIDIAKSVMVGNNISDMKFGRNAGMFTVFVKTTIPDVKLPHPDIDLCYNNLDEFIKALPA